MLHLAIHLDVHRQLVLSYVVWLNPVGIKQQPHHLPYEAELHKTGAQSEKHGAAHQNGDDDVRPKKVAGLN